LTFRAFDITDSGFVVNYIHRVMIFTEALKKEVFGPVHKNPRLAQAKIVERATAVPAIAPPSTVLKPPKMIAEVQKQQKPVS